MRRPSQGTKKSKVGILAGLFIFATVAILSVWATFSLLQNTTDNRNKAATDAAQVTLSSSVVAGPLQPSSPGLIELYSSTSGLQTDGYQLDFTVSGKGLGEVSVSVPQTSQLVTVYQNVQLIKNTSDITTYGVQVLLLPKNYAQKGTYSSLSEVPILQISLASTGEKGMIRIEVNNEMSMVYAANASIPTDQLQLVSTMSHPVGISIPASPFPSGTPVRKFVSPSSSPLPTEVPMPTVSPLKSRTFPSVSPRPIQNIPDSGSAVDSGSNIEINVQ